MTRGCPFGTLGNEVTENDELVRQDVSLIFEVIKNKARGILHEREGKGAPHQEGQRGRIGYGWVMLILKAQSPYAGESIPMHGGAIFGFQSVIQRILRHREVIVLLDNTDSPKLLEIALEIRRALAESH